MISLLLVSADPAVVGKVEELAAACHTRLRSVASLNTAKEWLTMQAFDALVVDSRYGGLLPIELLSLAWTHHPLLVGTVLDTERRYNENVSATAIGAHVFSGTTAYDQLTKLLQELPESITLGENSRYAILVVEDVDSPRDIIQAYVESLGYSRVDAAAGGEEALGILHQEPDAYFCVITDINMPGMNGIELTRRIRKDADRDISSLPVLMLTSVPTTENFVECLRAGSSGFLVKPPKKIVLRKELERAKRIIISRRSPRLCREEDAHLVEASLRKLGIG